MTVQSHEDFINETFGPDTKRKGEKRKPTHFLNFFNDKVKGNVGTAWLNDDGTIDIRLNACVTLTSGSGGLRLWPRNARDDAAGR